MDFATIWQALATNLDSIKEAITNFFPGIFNGSERELIANIFEAIKTFFALFN